MDGDDVNHQAKLLGWKEGTADFRSSGVSVNIGAKKMDARTKSITAGKEKSWGMARRIANQKPQLVQAELAVAEGAWACTF